jgi:hypothetical protein
MIRISKCRALGEGAITTYFNVLGLVLETRDLLDAKQDRYH